MNTSATQSPDSLGSPSGSVLSLTDDQITELFEGTNFGSAGETPEGRRGLMVECILKHQARFSDGSTIRRICEEAQLMFPSGRVTNKGARWAFLQIYQSGKTIVERLSAQNA